MEDSSIRPSSLTFPVRYKGLLPDTIGIVHSAVELHPAGNEPSTSQSR